MILKTCFRVLLVHKLYSTNYITLGVLIVYRSVFVKNYTLTLKVYKNNYERRVLSKQKIKDTYVKISYYFNQSYFYKNWHFISTFTKVFLFQVPARESKPFVGCTTIVIFQRVISHVRSTGKHEGRKYDREWRISRKTYCTCL
jgi:hypothetical protein